MRMFEHAGDEEEPLIVSLPPSFLEATVEPRLILHDWRERERERDRGEKSKAERLGD